MNNTEEATFKYVCFRGKEFIEKQHELFLQLMDKILQAEKVQCTQGSTSPQDLQKIEADKAQLILSFSDIELQRREMKTLQQERQALHQTEATTRRRIDRVSLRNFCSCAIWQQTYFAQF